MRAEGRKVFLSFATPAKSSPSTLCSRGSSLLKNIMKGQKDDFKIVSEKITSKNTMETIYVSKRGKKEKRMKVVYHYIEPKNEEEAREQQRNLDAAYDILFTEVERINAERKL